MYTEEEKERDFGGPDEAPEVEVDIEEESEPDSGVDVMPDPEPEEAQVRVPQEVKPKRDPLKSKFNQVMRDRERAYQAMQELQVENEQLRREKEEAERLSAFNYETNITNRLEQAKRIKEEALESGDTEAILKADDFYLEAKIEADKFASVKAQQTLEAKRQESMPKEQPGQQYYHPAEIYAANPEPYVEWHEQNYVQWANPESPQYDPWLTNEIDKYTYRVKQDIIRKGINPEDIDPDEYLGLLNSKVDELERQRQAEAAYYQQTRGGYAPQHQDQYQTPQRRELNMRRSNQPVSPVRSQRSGGTSGGRPQLTKEQAEMAQYFARADKNVDLKAYAKAAQQDRVINPHRYSNNGGN
jgi:hypothetical protein